MQDQTPAWTHLALAGPSRAGHVALIVALVVAALVDLPAVSTGWRGTGGDLYADADPVLAWDEAAGTNIVWTADMPARSTAQPVVIGDRVVTTAEPDLLLCYALADGRKLWERPVDVFALRGTPSCAKHSTRCGRSGVSGSSYATGGKARISPLRTRSATRS